MSIYIKVLKSDNPIYVGAEMLLSTAKGAVEEMISAGITNNDALKQKHHGTFLRKLTKMKYIKVELIKGAIREDREFHLGTTGAAGLSLPEATREWLRRQDKQEESRAGEGSEVEDKDWKEVAEPDAEESSKPKIAPPKPQAVSVSTSELQKSFEGSQGADAFGQMIATLAAPHIKPNLEFTAKVIEEKVAEAIQNIRPDKCEVYFNGELTGVTGKTHKSFKDIMRAIAARVPLWIVGEAGSGKTHSVHQAAEALGLSYQSISCGIETGKHELFGYMDANSNYAITPFRRAYEHGGVFLFDEIDAGSAEVFTSMNAALANSGVTFPDGAYVIKHKDFIPVACANTYGNGASRQYVGRQQIDAATLDRFVQFEFQYDEELELEISGNREWTRVVQRIRNKAKDMKQNCIISPRASINGAKLLAAGFTESQVLEMTIFKGMSEAQREALKGAI